MCVDRANAKRGPRGTVKSPPTVKRRKLTHSRSEPGAGALGARAASAVASAAAASASSRGCKSAGSSPILFTRNCIGGSSPFAPALANLGTVPLVPTAAAAAAGRSPFARALPPLPPTPQRVCPVPSSPPVSSSTLTSLGVPRDQAHQVGTILDKIQAEQHLMGRLPTSPVIRSPVPPPAVPPVQQQLYGGVSTTQWASMMQMMQTTQQMHRFRQMQLAANSKSDFAQPLDTLSGNVQQNSMPLPKDMRQGKGLSSAASYSAFVKEMMMQAAHLKLNAITSSPTAQVPLASSTTPKTPTSASTSWDSTNALGSTSSAVRTNADSSKKCRRDASSNAEVTPRKKRQRLVADDRLERSSSPFGSASPPMPKQLSGLLTGGSTCSSAPLPTIQPPLPERAEIIVCEEAGSDATLVSAPAPRAMSPPLLDQIKPPPPQPQPPAAAAAAAAVVVEESVACGAAAALLSLAASGAYLLAACDRGIGIFLIKKMSLISFPEFTRLHFTRC